MTQYKIVLLALILLSAVFALAHSTATSLKSDFKPGVAYRKIFNLPCHAWMEGYPRCF